MFNSLIDSGPKHKVQRNQFNCLNAKKYNHLRIRGAVCGNLILINDQKVCDRIGLTALISLISLPYCVLVSWFCWRFCVNMNHI